MIVKLYQTISRWSNYRFYSLMLTLGLSTASIVLSTPSYSSFDSESPSWETVMLKASDLNHPLNHLDSESGLAKKVYRLSVPLIIRLTGANEFQTLVLQYCINFLLLAVCYFLAQRILRDNVSASLITTGIAFIYFGRTGYYDIVCTWFDVFAYLFLVLSMYSRNFIVVFLSSFAASWTDERAFIALSIVSLFHWLDNVNIRKVGNYPVQIWTKCNVAVITAGITYLLLRLYLATSAGLRTPSWDFSFVLKKNLTYMQLGTWTFLEGFWIMFFVTIIVTLNRKDYMFTGVILSISILFVTLSSVITDITRSGSYLVPIIFVLASYITRTMNSKDVRLVLLVSCLTSIAFPSFIVCSDWHLSYSIQSSVILELFPHLVDFARNNWF